VGAEQEKAEYEQALQMLELAASWERKRKKEMGLAFYEPNPMQKKAHECLSRRILFCGGNRSGKSTFGCMEMVWHCTKQYPAWYPEEKRFRGPVKGVISATEFPIVSRVIEPKLTQYLPKDYYTIKKTAQGYMNKVVCKDGSVIDVLTSEMKDEAYESADWDFAWLDEPQQKRKYEAIMRGLVDRRGRMVITFTPLTEPWMKEDLIDIADGKTISVFTVNIRDNLQTVGGDAILSEEAIKEFESSISEEYRETRISGTFFHMRGLIYKGFGEAHQPEFSYKFDAQGKPRNKRLPVIAVLDPHDRNPHHLIWAFIDEDDDIYVDTEMVIHCELPELAKRIKRHEEAMGYRMKKRLIDPNFGRKPAASGSNTSVMQELAKNGAGFYEANDNVELRHMLTRNLLHYNHDKPITAVNKPKLFFSKERTPRTIRSMRNYQYQEWQGKSKADHDPKEVDKDKDTHGADVVGYLVISKPTYEKLRESAESNELVQSPY